jgi:hypothetical protein
MKTTSNYVDVLVMQVESADASDYIWIHLHTV